MDITYILSLALSLFILSASKAALILDKCRSDSECPAHSKCRPSGCDGYTCRCDVTFVYSDDRSQCIPGKLMGEECSGGLNKCLSPFAMCMDGICQCNELMEPTSDGRCKAPYEAELHQSCVEKFCVLSTDCIDDVCVCPEGKREMTTEEYWLDPMKARKCVDKAYDVAYCKGKQLPLPSDPVKDNIAWSDNMVDGSWNVIDDSMGKQFPNKKYNNNLKNSDNDEEMQSSDDDLDENMVNIAVKGKEENHASQNEISTPRTQGTISTNGISSHKTSVLDLPVDAVDVKPINDSTQLVSSVLEQQKPKKEVNGTFTTIATLKAETDNTGSSDVASNPDKGNDGADSKGKDFSTINDDVPIHTTHTENDDVNDSETTVDTFLPQTQRTEFNSSLSMHNLYHTNQETVSDTNMNTASVTQAHFRPKTTIQPLNGIERFSSFKSSKGMANNSETRISSDVDEDPHNATTEQTMEDSRDVDDDAHLNIRQEAPLFSKLQDNMVNNGQLQKVVDSLFGYLLKSKRKVSIYYGCITDLQCPEHAHCIRRGCTSHKQCLCRTGFMPNVNGTHCVQDASRPCLLNEFTCSNARCIPLSWVCDSHNDCSHGEDESDKCITVTLTDDKSKKTMRGETDRLQEKMLHETTMRMHLERDIQELRDEISRMKDGYINVQGTMKKEPGLKSLLQNPVNGKHQGTRMVKDVFYEGIADEIQSLLKMSEVYTFWGGSLCPRYSNTRTIYSGVMATGSTNSQKNGGQGVICLPKVPEYDSSSGNVHFNDHTIGVSGFTYHLTCAVCQIQLASTILTIPAKVTCPKDWKIEYKGTLVSTGGRHVCVEQNAIHNGGLKDSRSLGPDLYPVVVECGRISCPPYKKNHLIPCVVCSV